MRNASRPLTERLRDPVWQQEYNAALPTMREAADEIERLRAFVLWALTEGSWRGADLDGGAIQNKAIELNLVTKVKYDPAIHGEDDVAEEGDDWYVPR